MRSGSIDCTAAMGRRCHRDVIVCFLQAVSVLQPEVEEGDGGCDFIDAVSQPVAKQAPIV